MTCMAYSRVPVEGSMGRRSAGSMSISHAAMPRLGLLGLGSCIVTGAGGVEQRGGGLDHLRTSAGRRTPNLRDTSQST